MTGRKADQKDALRALLGALPGLYAWRPATILPTATRMAMRYHCDFRSENG